MRGQTSPLFVRQSAAMSNASVPPSRDKFLASSLFRTLALSRDDQEKKGRGDDSAYKSNGRTIHTVFSFEPGIRFCQVGFYLFYRHYDASALDRSQIEFIMGSRSRIIRTTTGPTVMTKREGRMKKKIGKTSFTLN